MVRTNEEAVKDDMRKIAALPTIPVPSVSEHKVGTVRPAQIHPAKWEKIQQDGDYDGC